MLTPAQMKRLELLILERDARAVTEALGRLGVVNFSQATAGEAVSSEGLRTQLEEVASPLRRVDVLRDALEIPEGQAPDKVPYAGPEELETELRPI